MLGEPALAGVGNGARPHGAFPALPTLMLQSKMLTGPGSAGVRSSITLSFLAPFSILKVTQALRLRELAGQV